MAVLMNSIGSGMNWYMPLHVAQPAYVQVSGVIWMP